MLLRKLFRIVWLLLLLVLYIGCNHHHTPKTALPTRLVPIGNLLPLFECTVSGLNSIRTMSAFSILEQYYRIDASHRLKPGKIIPAGNTWKKTVYVTEPHSLLFYAFATHKDRASLPMELVIDQPGNAKKTISLDIIGTPVTEARWHSFEVDMSSFETGEISISFNFMKTLSNSHDNEDFLFIGSPVVYPKLADNNLPNIVFFIPDTLRADYLGCYGMPESVSPFIDDLARKSHVFTSAIAASSWTKPSINAMMTGLYPHKSKLLGAPFSEYQFDYYLLVDELANIGYHTIGVSSNHLVTPVSEYDRGFDVYDSSNMIYGTTNSTYQVYQTISELLPEPQRSPFFLFVLCMDPHDRFVPPEPYNKMFRSDNDLSALRSDIMHGHTTKVFNTYQDGKEPAPTQPELDYLKSQYMGEIRYVDSMINSLIRKLMTRYSGEEFVFVLISDHGEAFMEHQSLGHGIDLYQETIHVPWLITRLPASNKTQLHPQTVSQVDVYKTLLGMLDRTPVMQNDGINLLSGEIDNSRIIFSMLRNLRSPEPFWRAAIQNNRKFIRKDEHGHFRFDLISDPAEINPEVLQNPHDDPLYCVLEEMINDEKSRREHYEFPDRIIDKLQQLGYIR